MPTPIAQLTLAAQPAFYSALQPPTAIDYTSKDWIGFATSMLNYAAVIFPEWDTTSEADFGVMLVELFAYMGDILSVYGDRLTQEAYLPTATQLQSVYNIAQLLGYTPSNGAAATGTVTFQTLQTSDDVVVPAGTQVTSSFVTAADAPVTYQTLEDVTVPGSGGTVTANVSQGITYTMVNLGVSNGIAAQSFTVPQTGVEDGTVNVFVSSSFGAVQWTQVPYLIEFGPDDTVYSVSTDATGVTTVNFGDNINGLIPGIGLIVYGTYTIGVGSLGNQPSGAVGILAEDIPGVYVPFTSPSSALFQSSAMTGGADAETIDQIRVNAPQSYATQNRAVTIADFQALSLNVQGITEASAVANHSTSVTVFALGSNYQPIDTGIQTNLLNYLSTRTLAGTTVTIGTPDLELTDVGASGNHVLLQVLPNFNQVVVQQNVILAIKAALSPPNTQFGQILNVSTIYAAIMAVPGVAYVLIPVFTRQIGDVQTDTSPIQYRPSEVPVIGNIFITSSGGII